MRTFNRNLIALTFLLIFAGCGDRSPDPGTSRIPVILDTDANNELDDQHAIAYLLANQETFRILGFTVNATRNGGPVENHYEEAMRVLTLFNEEENFPVMKGANGTFSEIREDLDQDVFDGSEAVNFIISRAKEYERHELVLLPIGKLTNIALALEKAPEIGESVKVVWLGSNYPNKGEYNLENDTSALQYLLNADVPFDIVTVNFGGGTGTMDITVPLAEIDSVMPGRGPRSDEVVTGRHGSTFSNFGDYSVELFHNIELFGEDSVRSLFDVGAIAILKNPGWGEEKKVPAPAFVGNSWSDRPDNPRSVRFWYNFDRDSIVADFYRSIGE